MFVLTFELTWMYLKFVAFIFTQKVSPIVFAAPRGFPREDGILGRRALCLASLFPLFLCSGINPVWWGERTGERGRQKPHCQSHLLFGRSANRAKGLKPHPPYVFVGAVDGPWQRGQGPPSAVQAQSSWAASVGQARQLRKGRAAFHLYKVPACTRRNSAASALMAVNCHSRRISQGFMARPHIVL